ncbi:MAG: hypothetical protein ACFFEF_00615 [Candidatus Thorarchaeota archaeon]
MGIFGTAAPIIVDFNLILQYVTFILLIVGYVKRKPFKNHGYIMLTVLLITVGTTLTVMAPRLLDALAYIGLGVIGHAAVGIIFILLGTLFAIRFITAVRSGKPLKCGTKNMMRIALVLWIIPMLFGTLLYIMAYVL